MTERRAGLLATVAFGSWAALSGCSTEKMRPDVLLNSTQPLTEPAGRTNAPLDETGREELARALKQITESQPGSNLGQPAGSAIDTQRDSAASPDTESKKWRMEATSGIMSNYYLRWANTLLAGPSIQNSFTLSHENGFYASVWNNTALAATKKSEGELKVNEVDITVGNVFHLGEGVDVNASMGLYLTPHNPPDVLHPDITVTKPIEHKYGTTTPIVEFNQNIPIDDKKAPVNTYFGLGVAHDFPKVGPVQASGEIDIFQNLNPNYRGFRAAGTLKISIDENTTIEPGAEYINSKFKKPFWGITFRRKF
jgi:hypothetical protein